MKPWDCKKLDECYKVKMVLDKDMGISQYVESIRKICSKCKEREEVVNVVGYVDK